MNPSDFIPPGIATAFAGLMAFVGRDHMKRDDARFKEVKEDYVRISEQLDEQNRQAAANHAAVLTLLIKK